MQGWLLDRNAHPAAVKHYRLSWRAEYIFPRAVVTIHCYCLCHTVQIWVGPRALGHDYFVTFSSVFPPVATTSRKVLVLLSKYCTNLVE